MEFSKSDCQFSATITTISHSNSNSRSATCCSYSSSIDDNSTTATSVTTTDSGSSETTFYVIAVYLAAAEVHGSRWAIPAALCADLACFLSSAWICRLLWG